MSATSRGSAHVASTRPYGWREYPPPVENVTDHVRVESPCDWARGALWSLRGPSAERLGRKVWLRRAIGGCAVEVRSDVPGVPERWESAHRVEGDEACPVGGDGTALELEPQWRPGAPPAAVVEAHARASASGVYGLWLARATDGGVGMEAVYVLQLVADSLAPPLGDGQVHVLAQLVDSHGSLARAWHGWVRLSGERMETAPLSDRLAPVAWPEPDAQGEFGRGAHWDGVATIQSPDAHCGLSARDVAMAAERYADEKRRRWAGEQIEVLSDQHALASRLSLAVLRLGEWIADPSPSVSAAYAAARSIEVVERYPWPTGAGPEGLADLLGVARAKIDVLRSDERAHGEVSLKVLARMMGVAYHELFQRATAGMNMPASYATEDVRVRPGHDVFVKVGLAREWLLGAGVRWAAGGFPML